MSGPRLSIVVVAFDMARELPRTVTSLLPPYQTGIAAGDVEIVVMDNRSATPVRREDFAPEADLVVHREEDGGRSPARAINRGVDLARADQVAVMVDGARLASPGVVALALQALALGPEAFVATLGFHLGPKVQQVSVTEGYDRAVEDGLLARIAWPEDGYRLFEICALGESYAEGLFRSPPETTFFAMAKARFQALGGYGEAFAEAGGGLAGFDLFERAATAAGDRFVMLAGEGTFHQLHYGATTRAGGVRRIEADGRSVAERFAADYEQAVGRPFRESRMPDPLLFGRVRHPAARRFFFPPEPAA